MKKKPLNKVLWQKIVDIDLTQVWKRLVVKEGFASERATAAILNYRHYMYLSEIYGKISPTPDVDAVWHAHILHLASYVRDCMQVFGRIIYHIPSQISDEEVRHALSNNFSTVNLSKTNVAFSCEISCSTDEPPEGDCTAWRANTKLMFSDCEYLNEALPNGQLRFMINVPINEYAGNPVTNYALSDFEKLVKEVF